MSLTIMNHQSDGQEFKENIMNKLKGILYGTIAGIAFGLTLNYIGDIPEVQTSYSTGDCVKVVNYKKGGTYSCENMPTKYNHVWVQ